MERIKLYDRPVHAGSDNVYMDCFLRKRCAELNDSPVPAVVIFPGGGYEMCSDREAEPIADVFLAEGYNVFIIWYTVKPYCETVNPLLDAAQALYTIRRRSDKFNIDTDRIAVCGFSAGGHLAGYISTCWNLPVISEKLGIDSYLAKPNAMILGYPVVTATQPTHMGSFYSLIGTNEPTEEQLHSLSLENLVSSDTCPAFVWHTSNDDCVAVRNSLLLCNALAAHSIPFELHVFPKGGHGLALANRFTCPTWTEEYDMPYVARWAGFAVKWLENTFYNGDYVK